jgi:hypothetical protein
VLRDLFESPLGAESGPRNGALWSTSLPPKTNHEESHHALALSNEDHSVARKAGTGSEEDWLSQATGDPAFWLKEPEQEAG